MRRLARPLMALLGVHPTSANRRRTAELRRELGGKGRNVGGRTSVFGWDIEYVDALSMLSSLEVLVVDGWNDFETTTNRPLILDCGANIGISVLNYKRRHPNARIIAFEPDPQIAPMLRRNLERNGAADTEVVEAAAWISDGEVRWFSEGADGSRIVANGDSAPTVSRVRSVDLRRFLEQPIDLLKIDVEGSEYELVAHIAPCLGTVDQLIVECHVMSSNVAQFGSLLTILTDRGFQIAVNSLGPRRDLVHRPATVPFGFDQYFVVAGWRRNAEPPSGLPA